MVRKVEPKIKVRMRVNMDWLVPGKRAWISFKAGKEYWLTKFQAEDMAGLYEVIDGN